MPLSQNHLQQIRSVISQQITELEETRSSIRLDINNLVLEKQEVKEYRLMGRVNSLNSEIKNAYKHLEATTAKINKLADLQRSVKGFKNELVNGHREDIDIGLCDYTHIYDLTEPVNPGQYLGLEVEKVEEVENKTDLKFPIFNKGFTRTIKHSTGSRRIIVADSPTGETIPDPTSKPSNPKDLIGSGKIPLHLWPTTASMMGSIGLLNGALKYGRSNFRAIGIRASIYYDACSRHLNAWFEGEECDPDDGVPHLAAALACLAIIVDAQAAGKFRDDRAVSGGYRKLSNELTPYVAHLKNIHEFKNPKHYTISDSNEMV